MSRTDIIALFLSILVFFATAWISINIFEGIPHLEDEFAYVWQAQVISRGNLTTSSPTEPKSFLVPFVVDYQGQRFGKYPIGWPTVLSFGEIVGLRWLINPILAGFTIWLTYRLGSKLLGGFVGLVASCLTAVSPFFLMNSSVLLSHSLGLFLTTIFAIAWLDTLDDKLTLPGWLPTLAAGGALGILALTRPYTSLGVAIPFGIHGAVTLFKGSQQVRRRIIMIGLITLLVGSLHFVWQYSVTGDPLMNPYQLWWEYDKVGFGSGYGVTSEGHSLRLAWQNLRLTINAGASDLFGWPKSSWIFLPFGLWAMRKERKALPVLCVAPTLILLYLAYWVGAWLFGPRYYYEGLFSATILTAAGISFLAGWSIIPDQVTKGNQKKVLMRSLVVSSLVALLVIGNLFLYIPQRIGGLKGFLGASREQLTPFRQPDVEGMAPALIIVETEDWRGYAGLLELASPMLDSPFIFIWDRGLGPNQRVMDAFPDRTTFVYNPDNPWVFYRILP